MKLDISALKTAIPYIRAYKGKTFVIKLGGEVCKPGAALDNLAIQFSLLYQLGINLVLVHGGGTQASELGARLGVNSEFFEGRRITSDKMLEVTKMALAGTVNSDLVATFRKFQIPTIGLTGIDADILQAERRPPQQHLNRESGNTQTIDFGLVGDIHACNIKAVRHLLSGNYMPVICSLAANDAGQILNVNADTAASCLAIELMAEKLFILSNVDGVLRDRTDSSTLISHLNIVSAEKLISDGVIMGGMLPKIHTCLTAIKAGIPRAHIVSGQTEDSVLTEVFTNEGCGTLLTQNG